MSLAALGLTGARFNAYDVWRSVPLPDLIDALTATLDPHSCITVAVRPAAARPQVIGTTRHVVQGAVDIVDEVWDAVTRTLRARSTNLDRRAYGVTIAVPNGMRPATCKADVPCSVRRLESGHAVLEWAARGDGVDAPTDPGEPPRPGLALEFATGYLQLAFAPRDPEIESRVYNLGQRLRQGVRGRRPNRGSE